MTKRALQFALALALAGAAQAQAPGPSPYAQRFAQLCAACHGAAGRSEMPGTPSLAGQPSFYAITQLFLFREGRRENPAMSAVAKTLSDDDLKGFSEYIASLPPAAPAASGGDAQRLKRGEALAQRHLCANCHGADYAGGQQVARLAGQREEYLATVLQEFKTGQRIGYTNAMNEAVSGVSAQELQDIAHFLARAGAR
jgi:cytochrome c553